MTGGRPEQQAGGLDGLLEWSKYRYDTLGIVSKVWPW